jgi:hypothetical protein
MWLPAQVLSASVQVMTVAAPPPPLECHASCDATGRRLLLTAAGRRIYLGRGLLQACCAPPPATVVGPPAAVWTDAAEV